MRNMKKTIKITMLTPKINVYGMKWRFYKTDDDDHPSVPHGHSLDGNYKLQLWSGNIFNVQNGKIEFKAKRKDMTNLYNLPGFQKFVSECRDEYMKRNPSIVLPTLMYRGFAILLEEKCKQGHFGLLCHQGFHLADEAFKQLQGIPHRGRGAHVHASAFQQGHGVGGAAAGEEAQVILHRGGALF